MRGSLVITPDATSWTIHRATVPPPSELGLLGRRPPHAALGVAPGGWVEADRTCGVVHYQPFDHRRRAAPTRCCTPGRSGSWRRSSPGCPSRILCDFKGKTFCLPPFLPKDRCKSLV